MLLILENSHDLECLALTWEIQNFCRCATHTFECDYFCYALIERKSSYISGHKSEHLRFATEIFHYYLHEILFYFITTFPV